MKISNASTRGRRNRRRAQEHELLVAAKLRTVYPNAERRTQSRGGRRDGCDVERTPFFIECKHHDKHGAFRFLDDMAADQRELEDSRPRLLVLRETGSRHGDMAVLELNLLLDLLERAGGVV